MNRSGTIFLGIVLVVFGIALLFNEYGFGLNVNFSWPVFLIFSGGILVAAYYTSRPKKSFLQGGMILICLGLFFTLMEDVPALDLTYRQHWPGILIAIGIGLLISGIIDKNSRKMISSGIVVAGIGILFLAFFKDHWNRLGPQSAGLLIGSILLLVGVKVVLDVFLRKKAEA